MHQGPRAQIDRKIYKRHMQETIFNYPNLDVHAGSVFDLVFSHQDVSPSGSPHWGAIKGVKLGRLVVYDIVIVPNKYASDSGEVVKCSQVVICTGTFLSGEIHIGKVEPPFAEHYTHPEWLNIRHEKVPRREDERSAINWTVCLPPFCGLSTRSSANWHPC